MKKKITHTYTDALAHFQQDISLWWCFSVQSTSSNEHNWKKIIIQMGIHMAEAQSCTGFWEGSPAPVLNRNALPLGTQDCASN